MKPTHQELVKALKKSPELILLDLTPFKVDLDHVALGIAGESGEVVDVIKKHTQNNKPLDVDKLILEMGDLEFYLEGLRQIVGVTRQQVLDANIQKLLDRYQGMTYSDTAAHAQRDKTIERKFMKQETPNE